MKSNILIIAFLLVVSAISGLSVQDIRFLMDKGLFDILANYDDEIVSTLSKRDCSVEVVDLISEYAFRTGNSNLYQKCLYLQTMRRWSFDTALEWLGASKTLKIDDILLNASIAELMLTRTSAADTLVWSFLTNEIDKDGFDEAIHSLDAYNHYIEDIAKELVDLISVERSDSIATALIDQFEARFPKSRWAHVAYYYRLYHLQNRQLWDEMLSQIEFRGANDPAHCYVSALYLMNPEFRSAMRDNSYDLLSLADEFLDLAMSLQTFDSSNPILFTRYNADTWNARMNLTAAKIAYYKLIKEFGLYGSEDIICGMIPTITSQVQDILSELDKISFPNNDNGEFAELAFWKAKVTALSANHIDQLAAARHYVNCMIHGAPRKRFEAEAMEALLGIHAILNIKSEPYTWFRQIAGYEGVVFVDRSIEMGLQGQRFTRVAVGDYDNDSWPDILFNGNRLFRNILGDGFMDVSDAVNLSQLNSVGGLWADFNQDGYIDLVSYSHASDGFGDALMRSQKAERFVNVNERAGDIDDSFPTEAAAWIDLDNSGYPSLYMANYETWQIRSGYPDRVWRNEKGYFQDITSTEGFSDTAGFANPGLAGRGVAPADYDNDGNQEILVTNYRLNRNFLFKLTSEGYTDTAFLTGISGKFKQGYYGHSIGADWGDFDNDGDLDLFIANLAHPRYIDISDISVLFRNDGLAAYVLDGEIIHFHQFTDVTKAAGITFDELHSDPLWFDADNDGFLDLFITSVYENDRSYLYHNNGDGTFTDITWLSGARVFNGWGNAAADINRDGKLDLIVGSGNGTKIMVNITHSANQSITIKPVWKSGTEQLIDDLSQHSELPNSPAFGCRVAVDVKYPDGTTRTLIRELSGGKGTGSQNPQELHFGLANGKVSTIRRINYGNDSR